MRPGHHDEIADLRADPANAEILFRELYSRRAHQNASWEGLWGKVTPSMYQLNLDFIEFLSATHRYSEMAVLAL